MSTGACRGAACLRTLAKRPRRPGLINSPINPLTQGCRLAPTASKPALCSPNQSSCRSNNAGSDGGRVLCWGPASAETFSFELRPAAGRPERQRVCRSSVGKSGRKAAPCGEWQESRSASRWPYLPAGNAAPGARLPFRRFPGFPSRGHGSR